VLTVTVTAGYPSDSTDYFH